MVGDREPQAVALCDSVPVPQAEGEALSVPLTLAERHRVGEALGQAEMLRELGVKPAKTLPAGLLAKPLDEDAEGAG